MKSLMHVDEILKYIPQKPPFVMVSEMYSIGKKEICTGLLITPDNILVKQGQLQESGMVENMAQSAALFAGYTARQNGEEPAVGYIAGIKKLSISGLPEIGQSIKTTVEITNEVLQMQIAQAILQNEQNEHLASCELRIFLKENQ